GSAADDASLSLHDALPIFGALQLAACAPGAAQQAQVRGRAESAPARAGVIQDVVVEGADDQAVLPHLTVAPGQPFDPAALDASRSESTRLNSSHVKISYAV